MLSPIVILMFVKCLSCLPNLTIFPLSTGSWSWMSSIFLQKSCASTYSRNLTLIGWMDEEITHVVFEYFLYMVLPKWHPLLSHHNSSCFLIVEIDFFLNMLMLLLPHWEGIQCRGKCRYTGCIIWGKQDLSPSPHPESNNIIIAIVLIEVRWRASWLPSQHLYPVCLFSLAPLKTHGLIDWPTWISIIPQLRTMSMGKMFAYCFWERSIIIKWDLPKALDEADIHHVKHGRGMKRNQFLETWFNCWIKLSLKSILSRFS